MLTCGLAQLGAAAGQLHTSGLFLFVCLCQGLLQPGQLLFGLLCFRQQLADLLAQRLCGVGRRGAGPIGVWQECGKSVLTA